MDENKARSMLTTLKTYGVAGWEIVDFIDNGKSAAVYSARRGEERAAIKIFDTELITKFGDAAMLERMEREKWLVGHDHPNIVQMIDSGFEPKTGNHYLIMEFLEGQNLSKCLSQIRPEKIPEFIEQLASAAEFLETKGLAHRDIKPANIVITDNFSRLVLLDFGVLRPVGEQGITDMGGTPLFVGTNQYASPEFALRQEEDTPEGWRAVTFYQIGAVLHDMLMQKTLFGSHRGVPARLAYAVQNEVPHIFNSDAAPYLVALSQICLVKSPTARLQAVSWDNFKRPPARPNRMLELQERIRQRASAASVREAESAQYETPVLTSGAQLIHTALEIIAGTLRELGTIDPPLPRRIVYAFQGSGHGMRADFEPADTIGLPSGLSVCIAVEILDGTSRIVKLKAASGAVQEEMEWQPELKEEIYVGPLDQAAMEEAVMLYVLMAVDVAQRSSDLSTNDKGSF